MEARKERYEREGYEVKTAFIIPPRSTKKKKGANKKNTKEKGTKKTTTKPAETIKDKIAWVKASENGMVTFDHHSSADYNYNLIEQPESIKGRTTGRMLAKLGFNDENLNNLMIRYGACKGEKEADDFYNALHEQGAGNFIGDAKTEINSTLLKNVTPLSDLEVGTKLAESYFRTSEIEANVDLSQDPPILKDTQEPLDTEILKDYHVAKQFQAQVQASVEPLQARLQRGDSLIDIKIKDDPHVNEITRLPRERDPETGQYPYNPHYIVPIKTETSQVEKTFDADRIDALRQNHAPKTGIAARKTASTPEKQEKIKRGMSH